MRFNLEWLVFQDCLALAKSLLASICLFYLTRPDQLLTASAVTYNVTQTLVATGTNDCNGPRGPERKSYQTDFDTSQIGQVEATVVMASCQPSLKLEDNDLAFGTLIVVNQSVFLFFIVLRVLTANGTLIRLSKACHPIARFLTRNSLTIAQLFNLFAVSLAIVKVLIALSYGKVQIDFVAPEGNVPNVGTVRSLFPYPLKPGAGGTNCTQITLVQESGSVQVLHNAIAEPTCHLPIICEDYVSVELPATIYILCFVYLFSSTYIVYLSFQCYKVGTLLFGMSIPAS
jgi:hypothetical protein